MNDKFSRLDLKQNWVRTIFHFWQTLDEFVTVVTTLTSSTTCSSYSSCWSQPQSPRPSNKFTAVVRSVLLCYLSPPYFRFNRFEIIFSLGILPLRTQSAYRSPFAIRQFLNNHLKKDLPSGYQAFPVHVHGHSAISVVMKPRKSFHSFSSGRLLSVCVCAVAHIEFHIGGSKNILHITPPPNRNQQPWEAIVI